FALSLPWQGEVHLFRDLPLTSSRLPHSSADAARPLSCKNCAIMRPTQPRCHTEGQRSSGRHGTMRVVEMAPWMRATPLSYLSRAEPLPHQRHLLSKLSKTGACQRMICWRMHWKASRDERAASADIRGGCTGF